MRPSPFLLTSLLAAALGCRDVVAPVDRSELDANRQKWAQHGYADYTFTLRMDCFCAINGPVQVVVIADSARQVTMVSTGEVLNAPWIPTIKKLFDFIDQTIARPAAVLHVTYDPTLGYPTEIVADPIANAVDDEVTYTVTNVSRLAVDPPARSYGTAPAAPARRGSAPAVTRPFSIRNAAP
jgi:Family of unknown function (DUF6174)